MPEPDLERLVAEATNQKPITSHSNTELVEELQARGLRVEVSPPAGEGRIRIEPVISETHTSTFAVVSDTHLGSRHQQLTYLHDFYGYAQERGASFVLHSGDMVDGPTQMHLDIIYEQFVHGYDAQVDYAEKAYPDLLPTYAIMGNHDQCVDELTEALTDKGWRQLSELRGDERFATLDAERVFRWEKADSVYVNPSYRGPMYHWRTQQVDHLVTPNHRMLIRSHHTGNWTLRAAESMPTNTLYWQGLRAAEGWVGDSPEVVEIPASPKRPGFAIPMESAIRLFGWYISEGNSDGLRVTISQSRVKSPHYGAISDLITGLGFKPQPRPSMIRFGSAPLAKYLMAEFGSVSQSKRIPDWIKALDAKWLALLVDTMIDGDGHWNSATSATYTTASHRLADDLQEICVKLGWGSFVKPATFFPVGGTQYVGRAHRMYINTHYRYPWLHRPEVIDYEGLVWCPQLPSGVWLARRNGKALWTGNSFLKNAGGNPVAELARRRSDIIHVGDLGAMVEIEGMTAYLWHPPGGNAYARSYKLQKFIEQYERGTKPHFVFAGHFHTSGHLPNYQNVSAFNVPCFQAQTPFIRRLGLNPDIGGIVIEVGWEEVDGMLLPARHKTDWRIYRRPIENDY